MYYSGRVNITEWVDNIITLRAAAAALNRNGSDDILRCNCKKGCSNKQCKCLKSGKGCGGQCHKGHSCGNKEDVVLTQV